MPSSYCLINFLRCLPTTDYLPLHSFLGIIVICSPFSDFMWSNVAVDSKLEPNNDKRHRVKAATRLRYLGFFLTPTLDWNPHVSIMAMRARSTIRGLTILGNSIRGLDLVHWKQVYLMYVSPARDTRLEVSLCEDLVA